MKNKTYISVPVTEEIINSLEDGKVYHCIANKINPETGHNDGSETGWWLKKYALEKRKEFYTHILLESPSPSLGDEITSEELELKFRAKTEEYKKSLYGQYFDEDIRFAGIGYYHALKDVEHAAKFKNSPVPNEEETLKTFLKWVEEKTHFFEDKDVTIKQIVSEWLASYKRENKDG